MKRGVEKVSTDPAEGGEEKKPRKNPSKWQEGLVETMKNPEMKVMEDEWVVCIKDKYPKAKCHFLVLPKEDIRSVASLKPEHVNLLQHMERVAREIAENCGGLHRFRIGYHGIQSMARIHLHVISDDFDSPCLKTRKHYNSFVTPYLVQSQKVIRTLREEGRVRFNPGEMKIYLDAPLKCFRCLMAMPTMPKLKDHLKACKGP